jgi:hypothetical protein
MPKIGVGEGGWSVMFTAFRSLVLRSFILYGVWWTELLAAATGIVCTECQTSARCTRGHRHTTRRA